MRQDGEPLCCHDSASTCRRASCRVPRGGQQEPLLPLRFCRLCKAAGSRSQPDFRAHCTLLSSAACCQDSAALSMLWREWWPQSLCLSPEGNSSPFCKPKSLPLRWGFLFLWEGSCSCLLASTEFSRHSAPRQNIAQLSQSKSKH